MVDGDVESLFLPRRGVRRMGHGKLTELRRQAMAGDLEARHELGCYLMSVDVGRDLAIAWLKEGIASGHAEAAWYLGCMLLFPNVGPTVAVPVHDRVLAEQCLAYALSHLPCQAEEGDLWAFFLLGQAYEGGIGVCRDYTRAAAYYRATGHYTVGLHCLGRMFMLGRTKPRNRQELLHAARLLAAKGNERARRFYVSLLASQFSAERRGTPRVPVRTGVKSWRTSALHLRR